ncbi:MAG: response regulator transcription factor [Flavobacteriales bacterium]|nr:response regulator transcription factor [Flavobacteriales bacterium]
MEKINVILADSSDLIRIGLRSILVQNKSIEVIGEARSGKELEEQVANFHPDIVVIDYTSNDFDIDIIPVILQKNKGVKFVAITKDQSAQTIVNALRSGVMSHIKKDCSAKEIGESVIETAAGNKFFCGQILERIRDEKINVDDIDFEELNCEPISLSERELEVITYIAEGHTNVQVAEKLFLSNHTVNTHRKNIMRKLGVNNTAGIVMYAVKTQLVSPNRFLFSGPAQ